MQKLRSRFLGNEKWIFYLNVYSVNTVMIVLCISFLFFYAGVVYVIVLLSLQTSEFVNQVQGPISMHVKNGKLCHFVGTYNPTLGKGKKHPKCCVVNMKICVVATPVSVLRDGAFRRLGYRCRRTVCSDSSTVPFACHLVATLGYYNCQNTIIIFIPCLRGFSSQSV